MDKSFYYMIGMIFLSFTFIIGVMILSPTDFERLDSKQKMHFAMPIYQELGLSDTPIKGYFKKKDDRIYLMYLNNNFDSEFILRSKTNRMIILSNNIQEMRLKFSENGDLLFVVQKIYENREQGIEPMDVVYPQ